MTLNLRPKLNVRELKIRMAMAEIDTYVQLAEKLGVSKQSLTYWAKGTSFPSDDNLIALAGVLQCSVDDLVILPKVLALPPVAPVVELNSIMMA